MNSKRLFLVGCPRSGTTLLQSMVASHSQVVSFPETHFFSKTLPINLFLRRLKLHGAKSRGVVKQFLDSNGYPLTPFEDNPSYGLYTHNKWCHLLLRILDQMIEHDIPKNNSGDTIWGLEKTPRHLHYISSIEQAGTNNSFLHILRNGPDVVASLRLATKQYPEQWSGERSVKKCIKWWNNSIRASMKYRDKPNHLFVVYEQLITEPQKVLEAVCGFLNLDYQQIMTNEFHHTAGSLTKEEEEWKGKNQQQSLNKSNKLETHFDTSTVRYIKKKTTPLDLKQFYH